MSLTFPERVLALVSEVPGITDRELTNRLLSTATHPSQINQACRLLASRGLLERVRRDDGLTGNYLLGVYRSLSVETKLPVSHPPLSEDAVKAALDKWLQNDGWQVDIAWGKTRGIDIDARRGTERWIIEAKGCGSLAPMRVNYFLAVIGETLQRMDDTNARYSIALPEMGQFRGLWDRLPLLAKARLEWTALFVDEHGGVQVAS